MKERDSTVKKLMSRIAQEGTIAHIEEIPQDIRDIFVTAHDITPEYHVRMQAAFKNIRTMRFPRP